MVILTPSIAALRQEARRIFPNACWLPGDSIPVGERVEYDGQICTVAGPYRGKDSSEGEALEGWWLLEGPWCDQGFLIVWPPILVPLSEAA